ncbi:MAG: hypothetical protein IMZ46_15465, partial [Acidobacteria bacterium]|nr:hypothetical protein [Acidobacteriota bacterium]
GEPDILFGLTDLRRLAEPLFTVLRRPVSGSLPFFKAGGLAASPASEQPVVLDPSLVLRPDELPVLLPLQICPLLLGITLLFSAPELLFLPLPLERFLFRTLLERGQVGRVVLRPLFFVRPVELLFRRLLELFVQVRRR